MSPSQSHATFSSPPPPHSDLLHSQRKRKRDHNAEQISIDQRPFTLSIRQSDSAAPFDNPSRVFTPLSLLSRTHLPLAWLDSSRDGSRKCIAQTVIPVLEACAEDLHDAKVLIAEEQNDGILYAIERIQTRVYALCRLQRSVKKERVQERSAWQIISWLEPPIKRQAVQSVENAAPWWAHAIIEAPIQPEKAIFDRLPKLLMQRVEQLNKHTDPMREDTPLTTKIPAKDQLLANTETQIDGPQLSAQDHLQDLAKHYLDALYLSRTSLAYFAKGPLSRTRAAFCSPSESTLSSPELSGFLREAILQSTTMDKKYRDGITNIIKELPAIQIQSPEKSVKPKKKRKWKSKRDKLGYFVDEKDFVEQWWRSDEADDASTANEPKEAAIKRRSAALRIRETHLQIIFILETLALESAMDGKPSGPRAIVDSKIESQDGDTQGVETQVEGETKKPKPKKLQDLPALLETLIERLCIWQSLEGSSAPKADGSNKNGGESSSNDELRNFCVEIIIPFYMSRIPKYATMANKKLGGPVAPTPVKHRSSSSRKPGEPAVRQAPEKKARKPLSRVLTETMNSTSTVQPPPLHRSATDTDILHVKQESSLEVPLASIPAKKSRRPILTPRNHASLMQSFSNLSRREIDLNAVSAVNEAKIKKKADADAKLREALAMIKKPNRALAHKEVAESADLSFAKATARHRPGTHHRAKPARPSTLIDVEATPKHPRTIQATPARERHEPRSETRPAPSSGASVVPASTRMSPRRSNLFAVPQSTQTNRQGLSNGIQETPSRGFAKYMPAGLAHEPGTLPESPVVSRRPNFLHQTPVKQMKILSPPAIIPFPGSPDAGVQATPLMKRPTTIMDSSPPMNFVEASPEMVRRKPSVAKDDDLRSATQASGSIYAALGWDDNDYDDLA